MKKAYYIDTYSTEHLHEIFDASSLLMFSYMYEHIEYRAARSSCEHVVALLGSLPDNISYTPLAVAHVFSGWSKGQGLLKQIQATVHNTHYILSVPEGYDIIFNYDTLAALPFMNIAARFTRNRILQICHGELLELYTGASKHFFLRRGLQLLRSDDCIAKNIFFAVLGKAIYRNVFPLVGKDMQERMLSFEHSTIFPLEKCLPKHRTDKLIIGTIGGLREDKGLSVLKQLAKRMKHMPNVELRSIGRIALSETELNAMGIVVPEQVHQRYLTRDELYEQIRQLDYALFLFQPEVYRFTASGSVFDAIVCDTPILSLSNDYFRGLFDSYGDFGYLENDTDSIVQRIEWLVNQGVNKPVWNMQKLRVKMSPKTVAKHFAKQWLPTAIMYSNK